jgi:hypothetical protein
VNRIKDHQEHQKFIALLATFGGNGFQTVGLSSDARRQALAAQFVDSVRRIKYLNHRAATAKSPALYTPYSGSFEPLGGAVALHRVGRIDDAYWLLYLATHFGKHKSDGWNLAEDFYGRFGQGGVWDWAAVSQNALAVSNWLVTVYPQVTTAGRSRRFGNHRKFETLKPGPKGTGHAVASYVQWISHFGSHQAVIGAAQGIVGQNPQDVFAWLFRELDQVSKLGRLGKFDLLCNLSNLMIAPIYPDSAHIRGSTGPLAGAKLLFGAGLSINQLEDACIALSQHLDVSPQAVEDALCNWQKSPSKYVYFRG